MDRPLIKTADELAPHLSGVVREPYGQYEYIADPPCHQSKSGRSFQFGDNPGGGVAMGCWGGCQGAGFVRRIEDALSVRIQIQLPDGSLTYTGGVFSSSVDWRKEQMARPKYQAPASVAGTAPRRDDREVLGPGVHATALEGGFGVQSLMSLPVWFPVEGKKAYRWKYRGQWKGFAQSEKAEDGGVALARNGGMLRKQGWAPVELKAWRTHEALAEQMSKSAAELRAALSQAGDAGSPCPHDVMIVDLDVHTDIPGATDWRDAVIATFQAAGCPAFRSGGGRGAHILLRLTAEEIERQKRGRPAGYYRWPAQGEVDGAHADLYPPGRRGLVRLGGGAWTGQRRAGERDPGAGVWGGGAAAV